MKFVDSIDTAEYTGLNASKRSVCKRILLCLLCCILFGASLGASLGATAGATFGLTYSKVDSNEFEPPESTKSDGTKHETTTNKGSVSKN